MSLANLTLIELRQRLIAHQGRRPGNLDVETLRKWAIEKDSICFWIETRETESRMRWKTVHREGEPPQPTSTGPSDEDRAYVESRLEYLNRLVSSQEELSGKALVQVRSRCAALRYAIREYCKDHGVEIPERCVQGRAS